MKIGLFDIDSKYHNLALMKISAYHKQKGDEVEFYNPLWHSTYDTIYCSKIFRKSHKNDGYITSKNYRNILRRVGEWTLTKGLIFG